MTNAITGAIGKLIALYRREPAATQTAAAIVYAGGDSAYRAFALHTGVLNWSLIAAAVVALYGLLVRAQVIPAAKLPPETVRQAAVRKPRIIPVKPRQGG